MADKNVTLGETSANQMSYLATTAVQELPIKDNNKDNTSDLEKSLGDQMSDVSSLATTSLQSLSLPLLPPCFNYQELILLLRRQRKVLPCFSLKIVHKNVCLRHLLAWRTRLQFCFC